MDISAVVGKYRSPTGGRQVIARRVVEREGLSDSRCAFSVAPVDVDPKKPRTVQPLRAVRQLVKVIDLVTVEKNGAHYALRVLMDPLLPPKRAINHQEMTCTQPQADDGRRMSTTGDDARQLAVEQGAHRVTSRGFFQGSVTRLLRIRARTNADAACLMRELAAYSPSRSRGVILVELEDRSEADWLGVVVAGETCLSGNEIRSVRTNRTDTRTCWRGQVLG